MSEPPILLSEHQGVATITLNRPRSMNALDTPTKEALLTALQEVSADPSIRCVVLTGSGRAFCAGQDLKEHQALLEAGDLDALWSTVPDLATRLASGPTLACAAIRRSVAFSATHPLSDSLAFEGEMMRRTGASS